MSDTNESTPEAMREIVWDRIQTAVDSCVTELDVDPAAVLEILQMITDNEAAFQRDLARQVVHGRVGDHAPDGHREIQGHRIARLPFTLHWQVTGFDLPVQRLAVKPGGDALRGIVDVAVQIAGEGDAFHPAGNAQR